MHKLRNRLGPLRVLDAVHRGGGVGRAAELLHVTPGAVSHQLRRLESDLGVQLVHKDGRDIAFTTVGTELALEAAELFDQLEAALARAAEAGANRRIRVKVIPSFAIKWLMPRLGSLYAQHADIDIEVATVARADDTELHNADFVVRCGDGHWPGLRADLLFPDELVLACSPALAKRVHRAQDVLGETLLQSMIAPDCWDRWLLSAGLSASSDTRFIPLANAVLCLQAAAEGLGIAVTQRAYITQDFATGQLVQPLAHTARSSNGYYLVSKPDRAATAPFSTFTDWLISVKQARGGP
ncbi:LysR family transcriptional regulator [Achromobacter sp. LC458]|uniref:LysR family transcriptional regulator n=1 Tax=Achromobacter spanius TaxID=217203 RepID=A0A2S5GQT6_9BURK|nr:MULTISPECIES: LysR substrate-binding domain-containing protein [Achromobacter]AYD65875.1 LysR family transcriptional regulator [Achromobacter sp. B7]MDX3986013.1 LysR substrate-binding domain-containing protein [Achromobacter sp.]PPA75467.1 LysR family transcriptional regulator [Achromobacter spanius]QYJ19994.1 LysR family transcriptional regulator [Achromobacter sp. ES-001]TRM52345.1 LysR family transcriptional regulator [Achromobacter sp. LC458]